MENLPAWKPVLRSRTALRTSLLRYFSDPSITALALGAVPDTLVKDTKTLGFIFETMCIRDLRVYADAIDGRVYHYRDKTDLECDAVVVLRDGRYGLIEIKLGGGSRVEEGAENLKKLRDRLDTRVMNEPSFLMVLTGIPKYAYRRLDGVFVSAARVSPELKIPVRQKQTVVQKRTEKSEKATKRPSKNRKKLQKRGEFYGKSYNSFCCR